MAVRNEANEQSGTAFGRSAAPTVSVFREIIVLVVLFLLPSGGLGFAQIPYYWNHYCFAVSFPEDTLILSRDKHIFRGRFAYNVPSDTVARQPYSGRRGWSVAFTSTYLSTSTNYGIHGKPAGAIGSLLTDYPNRLWVLFLRATIQEIFLFSLVYPLPTNIIM